MDGFVATLIVLSTVGAGQICHGEQASAQPLNSWTIMVYMAADNSVPLPWEDDINEMEAAEQAQNTNIVALLDTYGGPDSRLLRIVHDSNGLDGTIVSTELDDNGEVISGGEVNTGSPDTLRDFIDYCASSFSAHRYVLILWGHGAGWHGLCPDGYDFLTLPELRSALSQSIAAMGRPLDLVGVDACAQGSIEMIRELRGVTDVFVASEKDVPYEGLPYVLVLNTLATNPEQTPAEFGVSIANQYHLWSTINSMYSTTMAVFDMDRIDMVLVSLSALSSVGAQYDGIFHAALRNAAESSEHYEDVWNVDFGNLLAEIASSDLPIELREAALNALVTYSGMVLHSKLFSKHDPIDDIWANRSTGAVIYLPGSDLTDSDYSDLAISNTPWDEFGWMMRNDTVPSQNEPGPLAEYLDTDSDDVNDAVTYTWYATYDEYSVSIYRKMAGGIQFVRTEHSTVPTITIMNTPGRLELAVCASNEGVAKSYRIVNVSLEGDVYIRVHVVDNGAPVEGGVEVRITSGSSSLLLPNLTSPFVARVPIPSFSNIGDIVTVQIVDPESGRVIGDAQTYVPEGQSEVEVEIHDHEDDGSALVFLTFVLLPGLIIIAFALIVARENRKSK